MRSYGVSLWNGSLIQGPQRFLMDEIGGTDHWDINLVILYLSLFDLFEMKNKLKENKLYHKTRKTSYSFGKNFVVSKV